MTGEQHERAVEAMAFERFIAAYERDVRAREVAEKHWRQVSQGVRDAFLVPARRDIDAYLRSLAEQGVVLVDLREDECQGVLWAIRLGLAHDDGFSFPRDQNRAILRSAQDAIERRFGGNESQRQFDAQADIFDRSHGFGGNERSE